MAERTCSTDGCERRHYARGFCENHYKQWARREGPRAKDPRVRQQDLPCAVEGCQNVAWARNYCPTHYARWRVHGDPLVVLRAPHGGGFVRNGYRYLTVGKRQVVEHRFVMEKLLGRRLEANETVHHRNGNRSDNRPENLELWVSFHPNGQRVEDLVRWAHEIISKYEPVVLQLRFL